MNEYLVRIRERFALSNKAPQDTTKSQNLFKAFFWPTSFKQLDSKRFLTDFVRNVLCNIDFKLHVDVIS